MLHSSVILDPRKRSSKIIFSFHPTDISSDVSLKLVQTWFNKEKYIQTRNWRFILRSCFERNVYFPDDSTHFWKAQEKRSHASSF